VFFAPEAIGTSVNNSPANPIVTPEEIVPEWYLLPFYAILRSIPNKLVGVLALFAAMITLFFVPWLDWSKVRSARFRPVYKWFVWILLIDTVLLGYVGANPVDANLPNTSIPLVWMGRLATLYYFLHFYAVLPLVGRFERPNPLPDSIAAAGLSAAPHKTGSGA